MSATILGAIIGFIFGGICEIANRIAFEFQVRELERIAGQGGPFIDIAYMLHWWVLPGGFAFVFAAMSLFVHWLHSKRSPSLVRLWEEIGLLAVVACVISTAGYRAWTGLPFTAEMIGSYIFLFLLAVVLNLIFAVFLKVVIKYGEGS